MRFVNAYEHSESKRRKSMNYKALALDLDGTLINSNKEVTDRNKQAIWRAIDAGIAVILASGRPALGIKAIEEELELQQRGGYVLAFNGGNIIDCRTGTLLYERSMPAECIYDICKVAAEYGVIPLTYTDDSIVAENDTDEYVLEEAECNAAEIQVVENLEQFVNYPVAKFLVVGEHTKLLLVQKNLLELHSAQIDAFFSEDYFLEVVPAGIKKSASLDSLLGILGIQAEELVACGDGMNDISMLEYAGLAVAMRNAYSEVKKYADYIAPSNDEDGVAEVIERFLLS